MCVCENRLIKCTLIVASSCLDARHASIAKEIEAAEQLVRSANAQDAKLEDRHIVGHVHVQRHQFLGGQRMPGAKGAGGVHLQEGRDVLGMG